MKDRGAPSVASLERRLQDALGHPLRREIVRILNASKRPLSIAGLAADLGFISTAEVNYHVQVLRRCEVVQGDDALPLAAGRHCSYKSLVGADVKMLSVLRAAENWDRAQREVAARRSSRLLTMFRVPYPTRTLRLGLGDKSQRGVG